MQTDATQAIRDVENSLRDFISGALNNSLGTDWLEKCGVTPERLAKWKQRKEVEEQRQQGGIVEPRTIYYADFYDLQTILKRHWHLFSPALGDLKTIEVYLGELEKMRDAVAHGRNLLSFQVQLANGIAGELRSRLIRYRNKSETSEDYFPRIENARDSLGNIWPSTSGPFSPCYTKHMLRPGDEIDYVVTAIDPMGQSLNYAMELKHENRDRWQGENIFHVRLTESHIGKLLCVQLFIKSQREYHARGSYDDSVEFYYTVLPKK